MVTFYKGMVNFSRLTGNPEGKEEPIYAVSRPAPTTLNNLLTRGGKNCNQPSRSYTSYGNMGA